MHQESHRSSNRYPFRLAAIEGPSRAGKTTLIRHVAELIGPDHVQIVPEFDSSIYTHEHVYHSAGPDWEAEKAGLSYLLSVDIARWDAAFNRAEDGAFVLADRSVHTLLAHRFAVSKLMGWDRFEEVCEIATHAKVIWPSLIIYLDTEDEILEKRRIKAEQPLDSIIYDRRFNFWFRYYFCGGVKISGMKLAVLNGAGDPAALAATAAELIQGMS